ncbi:MAG: DUF3488 domain-containing protein [Phycisphaeraceae bacterium]|nr:DUF3488 domain-containing protein [Phycisphaeraceae bacterium]
MDLTRRYRTLVCAQAMLGVLAFSIAERNGWLLAIGGGAMGAAWRLTRSGDRPAIPRWAVNLGALAAIGWLGVELRYFTDQAVISIGHFMIGLQVLLLWGRRSHRDDAMALVLSMLEMVAASLLSFSLIYGLLLAAYSMLAIWTLMFFGFSSTREGVARQARSVVWNGNGGVGRLTASSAAVLDAASVRSLRRTGLVMGATVLAVAGWVFLAMPRSPDSEGGRRSMILPLAQVGFVDQIQLGQGGASATDQEPVLMMSLQSQGEPFGSSGQVWRLRGAVLDRFDTRSSTWLRSRSVRRYDMRLLVGSPDTELAPLSARLPRVTATITMRRFAGEQLFTPFPPTRLASSEISAFAFNSLDQRMQLEYRPTRGSITYAMEYPLRYDQGVFEAYDRLGERMSRHRPDWEMPTEASVVPQAYARGWSTDLDRVRGLAERIIQDQGLGRDPALINDERDGAIARALTTYLQTRYQYTLDTPPTPEGKEPITEFLFDQPRGHCEIFASSLAALARSLGMRARVITGYLASEYNPVGQYYVVRESDAHAWCEIETEPGVWRWFDPTPPSEISSPHRGGRSWLTQFRQVMDHLDFLWVRLVVAYDKQSRQQILTGVMERLESMGMDTPAGFRRTAWRLVERTVAAGSAVLMTAWGWVVTLGAAAAAVMLAVGLARRLRVRRRTRVLRDEGLSEAERVRLAREARHYLAALLLLERHGLRRPAWQPGLSYARDLSAQWPEVFGPLVTLTELFYRCRFGGRDLLEDEEPAERALAQLRSGLERFTSERPWRAA